MEAIKRLQTALNSMISIKHKPINTENFNVGINDHENLYSQSAILRVSFLQKKNHLLYAISSEYNRCSAEIIFGQLQ